MTYSEYFIGTEKYKWGHLISRLYTPLPNLDQIHEFEPLMFIQIRQRIEREYSEKNGNKHLKYTK